MSVMDMGLIIRDLNIKINDKQILNNFSLNIQDGEIHTIMGPNGTGKSTLSKVIMGDSDYKVVSGDILFDEKSILPLTTEQRAKLGVFLVYQTPISIEGVSNSEFIRTALNSINDNNVGLYDFIKKMDQATKDLEISNDMIHRSINEGFSGGERKKNEILQMKMLKPKFIILDELDSGLDVDSLKLVCQNINDYLEANPKTSILIITHYSRILDYLQTSFVHIMKNGTIVKTGDYSLALEIENKGYSLANDLSEN